MSEELTRAELEVIEAFCRELALALHRIYGRDVKIKPGELPVRIPELEEKNAEQDGDAEESQEPEDKQE